MAIVYVMFQIAFHGLHIRKQEDIDAIKTKLEAAARELHPDFPNIPLDSDVEVEFMERAGLFEGES